MTLHCTLAVPSIATYPVDFESRLTVEDPGFATRTDYETYTRAEALVSGASPGVGWLDNWIAMTPNTGSLVDAGFAPGSLSAPSLSTVQLKSIIKVKIRHAPFRIPELDREFQTGIAGAGAIEDARANVRFPELKSRTNRLWMGDTPSPSDTWTAVGPTHAGGPNGEWQEKHAIRSLVNTGTLQLALVGIHVDGGALKHRILELSAPSGVTIAPGETRWVNVTSLVKAYVANRNLYLGFEWIAVPPMDGVSIDLGETNVQALHDELMPNSAFSFTEFPLGVGHFAYVDMEWTELTWSTPAVGPISVKYAGINSLPTQCRLVHAQGAIPAHDQPPAGP